MTPCVTIHILLVIAYPDRLFTNNQIVRYNHVFKIHLGYVVGLCTSLSACFSLGVLAQTTEPSVSIAAYKFDTFISPELTIQVSTGKTPLFAGDPIPLKVQLSRINPLLVRLTRVDAVITRRLDSLANWFVTNKVSNRELREITAKAGNEFTSQLQRKYQYLREVRKVSLPGNAKPEALKLYDDGSHTDLYAADSIYANQFLDTFKPGLYQIIVRVRGESINDDFQREVHQSKYIGLSLSGGDFNIFVQSISSEDINNSGIRVFVTPQDKLGNYLGPGHASQIEVESDWGYRKGTLVDNLDGSYTQQIELAANFKQHIKIDVHIGNLSHSVVWQNPVVQQSMQLKHFVLLVLVIILFILSYRYSARGGW